MDNRHVEEPALEEESPVGPPPGPVLIAIDASEEAEAAFDWYVGNFHRPERTGLVIYHVIDLPPAKSLHGHVDVYMGGAEWQQVIDNQKAEGKLLEQKYREKLTKLKITGRVKTLFYSRPGEAIVEVAAKEGASLIVIGARGTGTSRKTMMGSTSDYVLKHAHCPVTTYRYSAERRSCNAKEEGVRRSSFSKLLSRLEKPRSRSNSFEVRSRSHGGSKSSSVNSSREGSRSGSPIVFEGNVDGTYRKSGKS